MIAHAPAELVADVDADAVAEADGPTTTV